MKNENMKHTPGPWYFTEWGINGEEANVRAKILGGSLHIAIVNTSNSQADARLIAAAPEMAEKIELLEAEKKELLAALEAARLWAVECYGSLPWLESAEAAIAKAKGETK